MRPVNPYHFMLLKRMIEFEFTDTLRTPSRETIVKAVANIPKISTKHGTVSGKSFAESSFRNRIWNTKNYRITDYNLDRMTSLVTKLGQFDSWEAFAELYRQSPGAEMAMMAMTAAGKLDEKTEKEISALAEERIGKMYERYRMISARDSKKYNLDENENDAIIIRPASVSDIRLIADLAKRVYPCPINNFDTKKPWHEKNNRIFVVAVDEFGELVGNLNLIPIKIPFYQAMKSGAIYEDAISPQDIHSVEDRGSVRCIYVEGYASLFPINQREFRRRFRYIVSGLADTGNDEVILCAIGGSTCGENVMKKYGMTVTGTAIDGRGDRYPFLEAKLKTLLENIDQEIRRSENISWTR